MNTLIFQESSKSYEKSLNNDYKKENGIYYTDSKLAKCMYLMLQNNISTNAYILDPSCGTGIFLETGLSLGYTNLYGADIDRGAIDFVNQRLSSIRTISFDSINNKGELILKKFKSKRKFDLIIGNPPYAKFSSKMLSQTDYLFNRTVKSSGDNLFIGAIIRSLELISKNGYISFVIPKSFLHVNSYSILRRQLLKEVSIISIMNLGVHFKNVRGDQIVITIQNARPINNHIDFYNYNDGDFKLLTRINQNFYNDTIVLFDNNIDFSIYNKFRNSYATLNDFVNGYVGRGRSNDETAISGKDIRKFGLKTIRDINFGNQIFIQNIYSKESGIIACFGGDLKASETVTVFTDGDPTMCKYLLGIIHSRLINYFLHRYCFNKSNLTMHVDAKYLKKIPFRVSKEKFNDVLEYVDNLETLSYLEKEWFDYYERLNELVYEIYEIADEEKEYIESTVKVEQSKKWIMINEK